jgi:putative nucleotidyltransferase with HDIG domain
MTRSIEAKVAARARRDPLVATVSAAAAAERAEVWIVGGFVRDAALGSPGKDLDLVAGARARFLVRTLEAAWKRRAFRFRKRGVTTWRIAVGDREVDVVDASRRGIDADLRRRELTINAIAFDLVRGRLYDPLRGARDLDRRVLRLPRAGVVREDPVRALRAARFLAQLPSFRLAAGSKAEIAGAGRGLRRASAERVRDEIDRMLLADAPARGLRALEEWRLVPHVLPELAPLRRCAAGAGRPDVWRHTLDAIEASGAARGLPGLPLRGDREDVQVLRWALLLHDISKPETLGVRDDGRPTFHGHEVLGAKRADALLRRLKVARTLRRRVCQLIRLHLRPGHLADSGAPSRGLRRLVRDAGADLPVLVAHAACDAKASGSPDAARRFRKLRAVLVDLLAGFEARRVSPLPRLVSGEDVMRTLGIGPGPEVGRILGELRELQEEGAITDRAAALARLRARTPSSRRSSP